MPSLLWLSDRSRVEDGRGFCPRARLLGYHIGANGYGIALKGTKLPLMTGIAVHAGVAPILEWCRDNDPLIVEGLNTPDAQQPGYLPVPRGVVRSAVQQAQQEYLQVVEARGFAYLDANEEQQQVLREQQYLIEGLIWAWCLEVLPEVLRRGRILEVENDKTYVYSCTCGLGAGIGSQEDHDARQCEGKGLMNRPDFVLETRFTKELEYHEFKSTSMDSITFRDKWEVMAQLISAVLDVERRYERHVQSIYIHGLVKGKREGDYNSDTGKRDGTIRQSSVFCYAYKKPGNPPMEREQWAADYKWYTEDGKEHRLPKTFRKAGVWELPDILIPEGMSKAEFWVSEMAPATRKKSLVLIGPLSRQSQMIESFLRELDGEEERWQQIVWELYTIAERLQTEAQTADYWAVVWPHPEFQAALDRLVPRSYQCRRYGKRNRCQFETPCLYYEGWDDPMGRGYIERRPHHAPELQQAIERGCLVPEAGVEEEWEQEL